MATMPAMAQYVQAIPFITTNNAVFTQPLAACPLTILEFNSLSTIAISNEDLNIDFPVFNKIADLGPITGGAELNGAEVHGNANVLPFGPVDLAFPSIDQRVNDSIASQRTYFFTDTFTA